MMSLVAKQIKAQIVAHTDLWAKFKDKVFWGEAPESIKTPYIVYSYVRGGDENTTKIDYIDTIWRVVAVLNDPKDLVSSYELIRDAFHDKMPVTISGATAYTTMYEKQPVQMSYRMQNFVYYIIGGDYRIRLKIGE